MLNLYLHDFSEFDKRDLDNNGEYKYDFLSKFSTNDYFHYIVQ